MILSWNKVQWSSEGKFETTLSTHTTNITFPFYALSLNFIHFFVPSIVEVLPVTCLNQNTLDKMLLLKFYGLSRVFFDFILLSNVSPILQGSGVMLWGCFSAAVNMCYLMIALLIVVLPPILYPQNILFFISCPRKMKISPSTQFVPFLEENVKISLFPSFCSLQRLQCPEKFCTVSMVSIIAT